MTTTDPRDIIANAPMSRLQVVVIGLCMLVTALDGFDVLAISFAAPGIAADWGIDRAALGVVLSMELIGMALGSVVLGGLADRLGRRPVIIGCLAVMAGGMYLSAIADSVVHLSVVRLITGLGIGGMLAATNAMAAEFANQRRRHLSVTLMAAGYPLGAILGGMVASALLVHFDWRSVFLFGALVTGLVLPLVCWLLPESVYFLAQRQPRDAGARINRVLAKMGHGPVASLPPVDAPTARAGLAELLSPALRTTTLLLTLVYFTHIMTFYFVLKWIPKIVVDMGFAASAAGGVLVWANVGGISGALLLSLLTQKFSVWKLVISALVGGACMVAVFGFVSSDLTQLSLIAALAGFFNNAAIVGMYALYAQAFPTQVRASGTGLVIGVGRGGAALGPIVAGLLFAAGSPLWTVTLLMAAGSLVAAVGLTVLARQGR